MSQAGGRYQPSISPSDRRSVQSDYGDYPANTPLIVYLDSIDSWKSPLALRLLSFFSTSGAGEVGRSRVLGSNQLSRRDGASKFHTSQILTKYDSRFRRNGISITITDAIVQAWKRLWIYSSDIEKSLS
jgi:hypothetical protein